MTSDINQADNTMQKPEATHEKLAIGEQLKKTRETHGLSMQEAAARLHLSPKFIHMLENDDLLQVILPPIYLRGYLRSYARLLNISEGIIASALEKLAPTPAILTASSVPAALSPSVTGSSIAVFLENNTARRMTTLLILLAVITSMLIWWYKHTDTSPPILVTINQPIESASIPSNNVNTSIATPPLAVASTSEKQIHPTAIALEKSPAHDNLDNGADEQE